MSGCGIQLSVPHRRWIHATLASVYATGIAWMLLHYAVNRGDGMENGWRAAETWMLRAHGATAMAALVMFGSLLAAHVPAGWNIKRNLNSGFSLVAGMALFGVTGWLLYYAAGDGVRAWSSYAHMVIGVISPLALLWHFAQRTGIARPPGDGSC